MMGEKKSQQLGPGLFDPEIPVGEAEEEASTESGKPLLNLEQCAISFNMFDRDNDGLVNKDELKQLASSMGSFWSDSRTRQSLWLMDSDKDGMVSFGEFWAWYSQSGMEKIEASPEPEDIGNPSSNITREACMNMFQLYDIDGNGEIDKAEFADIIASIGFEWSAEKCESIFNRLGSQEDGSLRFREFYAWFSSGQDFVGFERKKNLTDVILEPSAIDERKIFVRGFPWRARESTALKYFQNRCGNITEVKMIPWSRDGTPSGRCIVTFEDKESVEKAMPLHRNRMGKRWLEVYRVNEGDREEVHKVDRSKHGALIGIRGSRVKEMQAESGARIFFETHPESVMVIKGRDKERARAWALAQAILANDVVDTHLVEQPLHGRLIGAGGRLKKQMEEESGAHIVYRAEQGSRPRCEICGPEPSRRRAWQLIQAKIWECLHTEEERFPMDTKFHGTLVGKGSVVIKTLEEQSGARIKLSKEEVEIDGKQSKGVMICRGDREQRARAHELAQLMIKELPPLLGEMRDEDLGLGSLGALPMSGKQMWTQAVEEAMQRGGWEKRSSEDDAKAGEEADKAGDEMLLL